MEATIVTVLAIEKYIVHSTHAHRVASNSFIYYFIMLKWPQISKQCTSKTSRPEQSYNTQQAHENAIVYLFIYLFIHRVSWACVCVCVCVAIVVSGNKFCENLLIEFVNRRSYIFCNKVCVGVRFG